jgi:hypothetical protein
VVIKLVIKEEVRKYIKDVLRAISLMDDKVLIISSENLMLL